MGPGEDGPQLYAGGGFVSIDEQPVARLARWNGNAWAAAGNGVDDGTPAHVRALLAHDDGSGVALFVGGDFDRAGTRQALHVARMRVCGGLFGDLDPPGTGR